MIATNGAALASILLGVVVLSGQEPTAPTFEVASVKPEQYERTWPPGRTLPREHQHKQRNRYITECHIEFLYQMGLRPSRSSDLRTRLGRCRALRHRGKVEWTHIGRSAPAVRDNEASGAGALRASGGRIVAESTNMAELAAVLSDPLRSPVVDATGLTGRYDFTLDFSSFVPETGQTPDEMTATIPCRGDLRARRF